MSHLQDIEDSLERELNKQLGRARLQVKVGLYNGDAASPEELDNLAARAEHQPHVLIGVRDWTDAEASNNPRLRNESITVDVYVAAASQRSKEHGTRKSYPIIDVVESSLIGRQGLIEFRSPQASERLPISGTTGRRLLDWPNFLVFQLPFIVHVRRSLDA